jgi:predicted DNA-binding transcriptional regulator YafY
MKRPGTDTAESVLQRLLLILPLAHREDGVRLEELSAQLGVEPRRLLRDLEELKSRTYYLPASMGSQIQLSVSSERILVWTTGEFQRPARLTPREALALELALRVVWPPGDRASVPGSDELRRRLVEAVRSPAVEADDPNVALSGVETDEERIRRIVEDTLRRERELDVVYQPPGREAATRRLGPVMLVHAEGRWYLLARDRKRPNVRAYRLDRVLEARALDRGFRPTREDRDEARGFLGDGRVHDGGGAGGAVPFPAVVEYSSRIARWVRERKWPDSRVLDDGAIQVRHRVVDPEWLVRHVLSYGADARIREPEWMRARVCDAVRDLIDPRAEPWTRGDR